jgi:flavodoxin
MKVLVGYESNTGHTRQVAEAIAATINNLNEIAVLKPVAEIDAEDVRRADVIFLGTWVQGLILFGVHPAGAQQWATALPQFVGKPVGVFCTYAFNPRGTLDELCALLESHGAVIRGAQAFQHSNLTEGVEQFVRKLLKSVQLPVL